MTFKIKMLPIIFGLALVPFQAGAQEGGRHDFLTEAQIEAFMIENPAYLHDEILEVDKDAVTLTPDQEEAAGSVTVFESPAGNPAISVDNLTLEIAVPGADHHINSKPRLKVSYLDQGRLTTVVDEKLSTAVEKLSNFLSFANDGALSDPPIFPDVISAVSLTIEDLEAAGRKASTDTYRSSMSFSRRYLNTLEITVKGVVIKVEILQHSYGTATYGYGTCSNNTCFQSVNIRDYINIPFQPLADRMSDVAPMRYISRDVRMALRDRRARLLHEQAEQTDHDR